MVTKVKVIREIESLKHILPLGFETEIVPVLSDRKKILIEKTPASKRGYQLIMDELVAPIGSYEGYTFKGVDGETYNDHTLYNLKLEYVFGRLTDFI